MKLRSFFSLLFVSILLIGCSDEEVQTSKKVSSDVEMEDESEEDAKLDESNDKEDSSQETVNEGRDNYKQNLKSSGTISDPVTVENPTSMEVLVNKKRKLPDGYVPPDLVVPEVPFYFEEFHPKKQMRQKAATALDKLFKAAEQAGLELVAASGYRSYDRQKQIYENNVATKGRKEADKFSARPGTSEHQTGLAMDVTTADVAFALKQTFKQTDEGSWLAKRAHGYGFIIRYPEGKSEVTGYSYEPWHLRYVGKDIAAEIHEKKITLEEYFGL